MVLSQYLESRCARRLLAGGSQGVGYMLKERVSDIDEFVESVRRVAAGRVEIDPELADPACES
jgi:hypothetical protein